MYIMHNYLLSFFPNMKTSKSNMLCKIFIKKYIFYSIVIKSFQDQNSF